MKGAECGVLEVSAGCKVWSAVLKRRNFSAMREHCPLKSFAIRYSPLAVRYSLSFPVPCPMSLVPFNGVKFLWAQKLAEEGDW